MEEFIQTNANSYNFDIIQDIIKTMKDSENNYQQMTE